jgi:hypothetical protein
VRDPASYSSDVRLSIRLVVFSRRPQPSAMGGVVDRPLRVVGGMDDVGYHGVIVGRSPDMKGAAPANRGRGMLRVARRVRGAGAWTRFQLVQRFLLGVLGQNPPEIGNGASGG